MKENLFCRLTFHILVFLFGVVGDHMRLIFFWFAMLFSFHSFAVEDSEVKLLFSNDNILCSAAFERHAQHLFESGQRVDLDYWTSASNGFLMMAVIAISDNNRDQYFEIHTDLKKVRDYYLDVFKEDVFGFLYFSIMMKCDSSNVEEAGELYQKIIK